MQKEVTYRLISDARLRAGMRVLDRAIVRAMLERIEAAAVATAREIGVDTLDARLAAERQASGGTCI